MRIGILTSTEIRHRYFARAIRARFPFGVVGYARPGYVSANVEASDLTPEEARIVAEHFAERDRQEQRLFGHDAEFVSDSAICGVRMIGPGELNTSETVEFLKSREVDAVVVYGTDLVKPPLLGICPGRMINMHLGLSPYYRGTATNFYPLLNGEPEYVGATIHLIDAGIDTGPILRHARPMIVADDQPHTIGCKAILAGIEAMIAVLERLEREGRLAGVSQWVEPTAKLYLRKNYHPRQVVEMRRKIDSGLIQQFVQNGSRAAKPLRLIGDADDHHINASPRRKPMEV